MTDDEKRMFATFMAEHPACWACGWCDRVDKRNDPIWQELRRPVEVHNHHIVGGSGRIHVRWNIARLCDLCHGMLHDQQVAIQVDGRRFVLPSLSLANVLWLKACHDTPWYQPEDLRKLRGRASIVAPAAPDRWYFEQYELRTGVDLCPTG